MSIDKAECMSLSELAAYIRTMPETEVLEIVFTTEGITGKAEGAVRDGNCEKNSRA